MAEPPTQNHIQDWLGSPDGIRLLNQTAGAVCRYLSLYRIYPRFFNPNDPSISSIEEIRSELVRFILESGKVCQVLTGASSFHAKYLRQSFIHRCIDSVRVSGGDDFRVLYRAMNRFCRESGLFVIEKTKHQACRFSMKSGSLAILPLSEEDLRDIAFPNQLAFDGWLNHITHKRFLLPVLQYFWESVSRMWDNQPVWIELRAAAHWLLRFIATEGSRQVHFSEEAMTDAMFDEDSTTASPEKPFEFHFTNPAFDAWFDPDQVNRWASIFPKRLSDAEKAIFYLRHCIELELKAIAQRLQYKSASGPAYPLKKAEEKLASFAAELPWISPDDLNPEAFSLFREELCAVLKESVSAP